MPLPVFPEELPDLPPQDIRRAVIESVEKDWMALTREIIEKGAEAAIHRALNDPESDSFQVDCAPSAFENGADWVNAMVNYRIAMLMTADDRARRMSFSNTNGELTDREGNVL